MLPAGNAVGKIETVHIRAVHCFECDLFAAKSWFCQIIRYRAGDEKQGTEIIDNDVYRHAGRCNAPEPYLKPVMGIAAVIG